MVGMIHQKFLHQAETVTGVLSYKSVYIGLFLYPSKLNHITQFNVEIQPCFLNLFVSDHSHYYIFKVSILLQFMGLIKISSTVGKLTQSFLLLEFEGL